MRQTVVRCRFSGRIAAATAAVAGLAVVVCTALHWESTASRLERAEQALAAGQYAEAEDLARQAARDPRLLAPAMLVAGQAAVYQGRPADAMRDFDRIPDDGTESAVEARCLAGDLLLNQLYRMADAEQRLRQALAQNPRHLQANSLLAYLLGLCGRHWEAIPHRLELIRQDSFSPTELLLLGLRETARENADVLAEIVQRTPDDPLAKLGAAVQELRRRNTARAEVLLREALAEDPALIEAQVQLGKLLHESRRAADFIAWNSGLPQAVSAHPELWALRGDFAQERGERESAARCYWEALRRDPCHQRAAYQLGRVLPELDAPEQAAPCLERAKQLQELLLVMKEFSGAPSADAMRAASTRCESLGLLWEAWGWSRAALQADPHLAWAGEAAARLRPQLATDLPRTAPTSDPLRVVNLAHLPIPHWDAPASDIPAVLATRTTVRFAEEAASAGILFSYFNDHDSTRPAPRPFEFTGGGVAVIDYDNDAWPDLYLAQGCEFPERRSAAVWLDRMFRNFGNGRFAEVTAAACVYEDRYSQGVTVGDFDDDGFADIYVANLDENRLYRNNGDGTFSNVTADAGVGGNRWTTSCVMADVNGDAWPDIFAVNYLAGADVFERLCYTGRGEARNCTPHDFESAADQLYLNLGDGRFLEAGEETGINAAGGKGLGVVVADLTGADRLDLFVANDTDGNHHFVYETATRGGGRLRFRETALTSGLAFDRNGLGLACMGVAVGDANADGRLDLFVTNYFDEANTLYVQEPGGVFRDATREAGLSDPSLDMLGFGTQFLDGDADGHPDLIVANGHVEDNRRRGIPYQMRPQYFRNSGTGRFEQIRSQALGPYFERPVLGRALARLDWNRDGREDAVVTHLDAPAALLTNLTPHAGNTLTIQLRGISGSRDAIGVKIRVTAGAQTWSQQLTAGDGYQASNQRQLVFGLGAHDRIDELMIDWPGGSQQRFADLPVNHRLLSIEGRAPLLTLP